MLIYKPNVVIGVISVIVGLALVITSNVTAVQISPVFFAFTVFMFLTSLRGAYNEPNMCRITFGWRVLIFIVCYMLFTQLVVSAI
jgi:hypothetical protein